MNSPELTLECLDRIVRELARDDLTFAEKAGLYAATKVIGRDLDEYIDEERGGDGYAHEKVGGVIWHVGAALGFDITNNHPADQHRSWAFGSLSSLKNVILKEGSASESAV